MLQKKAKKKKMFCQSLVRKLLYCLFFFFPILNHNLNPSSAIRDPYTWMQSMCRQPYGAQFDHNKDSCPNIIPYPEDIASHPRHGKVDYMPVWITYSKELKVKHLSLAHLWNEWYYPYMWNVSYPRLMVRLEDLLFHADTVLPQICECMGGRYHQEVKHHAEVANRNRGIDTNETSQGLLRSIIKYGNIQNRRKGYPSNQLQAAKEILDPKAMELFGYRYETPDIYPPIRLTQIGNSRK